MAARGVATMKTVYMLLSLSLFPAEIISLLTPLKKHVSVVESKISNNLFLTEDSFQ